MPCISCIQTHWIYLAHFALTVVLCSLWKNDGWYLNWIKITWQAWLLNHSLKGKRNIILLVNMEVCQVYTSNLYVFLYKASGKKLVINQMTESVTLQSSKKLWQHTWHNVWNSMLLAICLNDHSSCIVRKVIVWLRQAPWICIISRRSCSPSKAFMQLTAWPFRHSFISLRQKISWGMHKNVGWMRDEHHHCLWLWHLSAAAIWCICPQVVSWLACCTEVMSDILLYLPWNHVQPQAKAFFRFILMNTWLVN